MFDLLCSMNHARPFTLQIHAPFGEPEGLRIIEKDNWSGRAVVFPRSVMSEARDLEELQGPGVYILRGPGPGYEDRNRIYVGQSDDVQRRLIDHTNPKKGKEFWTEVVAVTSKDANLNKAHILYLEARLAELADEADRATLDNRTGLSTDKSVLSRADLATAESFLENALICLQALGIHEFEPLSRSDEKPIFTFRRGKVTARLMSLPGGFAVLAGSRARISESKRFKGTSAERLRDDLIARGSLKQVEGSLYEFMHVCRFKSAGIAGTICYGTFGPDRSSWIGPDGRTLKQWQDEGPPE